MPAMKRFIAVTIGLACGALAGTASAGPLDDPGFAKSLTCSACHGAAGNSRSDFMPIIAGMSPAYFKKQIEAYAGGKRPSPEMEPYAKMVLVLGVDEVARYFGEQKMQPTPIAVDAGAVARGRTAAAQCATCHGPDGKGNAAMQSPSLAGQPPGFLREQMLLFKQDKRNPGRRRAQGGEGADADHSRRDVHGPRRLLLEPPVARPQAGALVSPDAVTLAFAVTLIVLGFVGAFVSGLVGVGGAIVMVPLLYYVPPVLGVGSLDIKHVAGITMAQVLAASAVGAVTHGRGAMIHRRLAVAGGAAMAAGSLIGAIGSRYVSGRGLLTIFAVMTSVALPLMFVRPAPHGAPAGDGTHVPFNRATAVTWPGLIGLASGLVGAGGAFLLVPVLIAILRVPVRVSIGTSLAMITASALMGFLGKAITGQIPLGPALAVIAGSLTGAPLGAKVSHRAPITVLRVVLGVLIAVVSIRVWADVLWH